MRILYLLITSKSYNESSLFSGSLIDPTRNSTSSLNYYSSIFILEPSYHLLISTLSLPFSHPFLLFLALSIYQCKAKSPEFIEYSDYRFLIRKMQSVTPNSTQFLEELVHQPLFGKALEQQLKRQHFFEAQDFNRMPDVQRPRVSQKLLQNRLRRVQINIQKQQEIQSLLQRRRLREREISTNIRNRLDVANRKKEENLRQSNSQQENRRRWEEMESKERLKRFQANLEKIEKGRSKVEEKKHDYIFKIQRKTEDNLRRVNQKRRLMQSMEEAENDQVHMEEWNNYRGKLMRKYEGRQKSPPDHLYQNFKQKNNLLKNMFAQIIAQKKEQPVEATEADPTITSSASSKSLMRRTRKVQYFGIHEQSMVKKTLKDIQKLRKFLQNQGDFHTFQQREEVQQSFKHFFLHEILQK